MYAIFFIKVDLFPIIKEVGFYLKLGWSLNMMALLLKMNAFLSSSS